MSYIEEVKRRASQCPFSRLIGLEVEEVGPGYARVAATVSPEHCNWMGTTHGGWLASLADYAFSLAVNSVPGTYVAIQLHIQFFKSPQVGERVAAESRVAHQGKTLGAVEVRVTAAQGKLIAQGMGLAIAVGDKPIRGTQRKPSASVGEPGDEPAPLIRGF